MAVENTFLIIKPHAEPHATRIMQEIEAHDLRITHIAIKILERAEAVQLHGDLGGGSSLDATVKMLTSGPAYLLVIEGENAVTRLLNLAGNPDPLKAGPGTLRSTYGMDVDCNGVHAASSVNQALNEIKICCSDVLRHSRFFHRLMEPRPQLTP